MTDFRALCVELTDCLEKADWPHQYKVVFQQWTDIAHAALAEPDGPAVPDGREPASVALQPSDGEVAELVAKLRRLAPHNPLGTADPTIIRAAELLQQQHPTPVPVSELLPGPSDVAPWPKDSDASAWCWLGREVDGGWEWEHRSAGYLVAFLATSPTGSPPTPCRCPQSRR